MTMNDTVQNNTNPAPQPVDYGWHTSREAAQTMGVHVNFLLQIPAAELPYYLVGRNRRYKMADIDRYLESKRVSA